MGKFQNIREKSETVYILNAIYIFLEQRFKYYTLNGSMIST